MKQQCGVVITGVGLATPLGVDVVSNWAALTEGRSGLRYIESFDYGAHPCRALGMVPNIQPDLDAIFSAAKQRKTERFMHLAVIAAHQAMIGAGLSCFVPSSRDRFGVYLGVGMGGVESVSEGAVKFKEGGAREVSPFLIPRSISSEAPAWLSMEWDLQGPMLTTTNACASSADAIGLAFRLIRDGYADYMLTGGTESCVTPLSFAGFANMRALSSWQGNATQASRPFDKQRSGFVMAEGAGMVVLEREDLARARGATMIAKVVGYGASADAFHITSPHPDGRGATLAIKSALADAGLNHDEIGYINAHGTGTRLNDRIESEVIEKIFGARAIRGGSNSLTVSSTKSMMGHALGAAGAIELIYTALALQHQVIPPTINCDEIDDMLNLDYVPNIARDVSVSAALSNSFGFGGGNSVLALQRV